MKQNFKDQFQSLRNIIQTNVSTLKELVKQADNLSNIIRQLTDNDGGDGSLKKQLEETKSKISESIEVLVEQTQKLFQAYDKLIEEVFGKK